MSSWTMSIFLVLGDCASQLAVFVDLMGSLLLRGEA